MAAQAAMPSRRPESAGRHESAGRPEPAGGPEPAGRPGPAPALHRRQGAIPLTIGFLYGIVAAFLTRDGGSLTGWDVLTGVVCGIVMAALCFLLGRVQHTLIPVLRAAAYAALTGIVTGFLHSLADTSILRSAGMGVALACGMGIAAFYVFYTREGVAPERTGTEL